MADTPRPRPDLNRLLKPRSVVIVGASATPGSLGAAVLANLDRNGFVGPVHLINPKRTEIGARACLPDISALPLDVDVAVLAIPRAGVLTAIRALAERRCGAAIVFSAGFAEGGPEGLAEQQQIAEVAAEAGMVVEGPNCLGLVNYAARIPLTFVETLVPPPGHGAGIGIVSQSGAMSAVLGSILLARAMHVTLSVSTGNEASTGVEDYVEHLVGDPDTRVIAMIVEQFRQPQRFLVAARAARAAGKLIVLLHPGRSEAARDSAATHTGALAGDYALMQAMVQQAGVVLAETLEELGDITEIASRCPRLPTGGTGVLGESGAFKALTLDLCEALDLPLPPLGDDDAPDVRAALPSFVGVSNPLDITAQGLVEPDMYGRLLKALHDDPRFGVVLLGIIQTDATTMGIKLPPILKALAELGPKKPVIYAGLDEATGLGDAHRAALRAAGVPVFPGTERAMRAMARLVHHGRLIDSARMCEPAPLTLPAQGGMVAEYQAKALLGPLGLRFPEGGLARTQDEAKAIAARIGYPVVIKAQAAQLAHKSDAGGVILNLANEAALTSAWARLHANIAAHDASLVLDGVLVEAMGQKGLELIIGAKRDADWGPVVMIGMGGVTAEILKDVRLITPDMDAEAVAAELKKLRAAPLLAGYRGSPALDVSALVALAHRLHDVMAGTPSLRELDLNPVILHPEGQGLVALDALILADPIGK